MPVNLSLKKRQWQQSSGQETGVWGSGDLQSKQFAFKSLTYNLLNVLVDAYCQLLATI